MSQTFNYRERAELFGAFLSEFEIKYREEQLLDVMACINTRTLEAYLSDVNIHIRKSYLSNVITASTIHNDRDWVKLKAQITWQRLIELSNSRSS